MKVEGSLGRRKSPDRIESGPETGLPTGGWDWQNATPQSRGGRESEYLFDPGGEEIF